ncbi:MAG: nucleotidyltransferase domain-containing protein [Thiobacillus sp.]|nr:MAG: hypothetical protein B7Y27_05545 [Hydrogenophilales bacterium 16-64-40]OZA33831.1 MAG: hypothetical protein B7X82_07890 [Hydrogenophilales bacterium 17-64-65]HQT33737.1 nucleotidyltransferase domain-containing protein [Thiobacillus sp.]
MTVQLTVEAAAFIKALLSVSPPPDEVWLIGSRANGRETNESDTDLLVFGSSEFAAALKTHVASPERIDCLVTIDGDNYQDPWQQKSGSLTELKWEKTDESSATYIGVAWDPDEEASRESEADMGDLVCLNERAIRVHPTSAPSNAFSTDEKTRSAERRWRSLGV